MGEERSGEIDGMWEMGSSSLPGAFEPLQRRSDDRIEGHGQLKDHDGEYGESHHRRGDARMTVKTWYPPAFVVTGMPRRLGHAASLGSDARLITARQVNFPPGLVNPFRNRAGRAGSASDGLNRRQLNHYYGLFLHISFRYFHYTYKRYIRDTPKAK